ncbi:MAG: hypothetical protein CMA77_05900 [Euryarchaeota archaeon]|nr:hypothetical protein [Euryarchaeota archaeon]
MTAVSGSASSSGHITLLFSILDDSNDLLEQGSRGIGICIDTNEPTCTVTVEGTHQDVAVSSKEEQKILPLHETVMEELRNYCPEIDDYVWQINQHCTLPQQQGFGLSAAGALASTLAFQKALGVKMSIAHPRSFHIAHIVERKMSGGLGDVSALWSGGVDLRREPGCPTLSNKYGGPGQVESWNHNFSLLVAWRNRKTRHTSSYIDDPEWKVRIRLCGEEAISPLLLGSWNSSRWKEIIAASTSFATKSELASDAGRADLLNIANVAIRELKIDATPLLCMLGESVAIFPNNIELGISIHDLELIREKLEKAELQSCIVSLSNETLR